MNMTNYVANEYDCYRHSQHITVYHKGAVKIYAENANRMLKHT